MRIFKYVSICFIVSILIFYLWREPIPYQIMTGQTMGTYYSIKVKTDKESKLLHKHIKQELDKINTEMSVFDNNSEITKINKEQAGVWIELSEPMQKVLKKAHSIYKLSNGNFDPTVGRLVDLWGFGTIRPKKAPSDDAIKEILKSTGFHHIHFNNNFDKIKKDNDNTMLNLSAIAKGYGVDRIAELLEQLGYKNYVVEIGGEVRAGGEKSQETKGWNVGIVLPQHDYKENAYVVTLKNEAVATSGDYRNFIYLDDKKLSHTICPQTGYPAENSLVSVTVFHKSCMSADALATAMMAMGEKSALDFANRQNLSVVMFTRNDNDTVNTILSKKAQRLLKRK